MVHHVSIEGEITAELADRFADDLAAASGEPVAIFVDSWGGDLGASWHLAQAIVNYKGPTVALLLACDSGAMLAAAASDRVECTAGGYAFHKPQVIYAGVGNDPDMLAERETERMCRVFAMASKRTPKEWRAIMASESTLSAAALRNSGLADGMCKYSRDVLRQVRDRLLADDRHQKPVAATAVGTARPAKRFAGFSSPASDARTMVRMMGALNEFTATTGGRWPDSDTVREVWAAHARRLSRLKGENRWPAL